MASRYTKTLVRHSCGHEAGHRIPRISEATTLAYLRGCPCEACEQAAGVEPESPRPEKLWDLGSTNGKPEPCCLCDAPVKPVAGHLVDLNPPGHDHRFAVLCWRCYQGASLEPKARISREPARVATADDPMDVLEREAERAKVRAIGDE